MAHTSAAGPPSTPTTPTLDDDIPLSYLSPRHPTSRSYNPATSAYKSLSTGGDSTPPHTPSPGRWDIRIHPAGLATVDTPDSNLTSVNPPVAHRKRTDENAAALELSGAQSADIGAASSPDREKTPRVDQCTQRRPASPGSFIHRAQSSDAALLALDHHDDSQDAATHPSSPPRTLWDQIKNVNYHTPVSVFLLCASIGYLVYGGILAHQAFSGDSTSEDDLTRIGPIVTEVAGDETDYTNIGISAALTIPTALVTMIVERIHLFEYRRSSGLFTNLEEPTWSCHVSWSHPVNYMTSGLVFFFGTLAQTAASVALVDLVQSDRPVTEDDMQVTAVRGSRISVVAMVVHATSLLLLSAWTLWLGSIRASAGSTLLEQLAANDPQNKQIDVLEAPLATSRGARPTRNRTRPTWDSLNQAFYIPKDPTSPTLFQHSLGLFILTFVTSPIMLGVMLASTLRSYGRSGTHITFNRPSFPRDADILPLVVPFPSTWSGTSCFLASSGIFLAFNIVYDIWVQTMQTVAFRADWELIWWSRLSDAVNGNTELEWTGKGSVSLGVFVFGRGVMGLVLSKAFVLSSFVILAPDDEEFRAVGLIAVTAWCLLAAGLMLLSIVCFFFFGPMLDVAALYPNLKAFDEGRRQLWRKIVGKEAAEHETAMYDGMRNYGEKSLWMASGVWRATKDNGWKYGAITLPQGRQAGILGWGPATSEPIPGWYRWLGVVPLDERWEVASTGGQYT